MLTSIDFSDDKTYVFCYYDVRWSRTLIYWAKVEGDFESQARDPPDADDQRSVSRRNPQSTDPVDPSWAATVLQRTP